MKTAGFLAVQAVCGAIVGWLVCLIMLAVAVPNFSTVMMPAGMVESFAKLETLALMLPRHKWLWSLVALVVPAVAWYHAARVINPRFPAFPFWDAPKRGMAWLLIICSGVLFFGGLFIILTNVGRMGGGAPGDFLFGRIKSLQVGLGVLVCACGWFFVSEDGGAGDLSTWKTLKRATWRKHMVPALSGVAFGVTAAIVTVLVNEALWFLFQLNVEVWAYCAETCFEGAMGITASFCLMGAVGFVLAFSAVPAIASEDPSAGARLRKAIPFFALSAVAFLAVAGLYSSAVAKNDWGYSDLAAAADLDSRIPPAKTLLFLDPGAKGGKSSVGVDSWDLEARYGSMTHSGRVPATEENAELLKRFLGRRGKISRHRETAIAAYAAIYAALWEQEKCMAAREWVDSFMGPEYGTSIIGVMTRLAWLARAAPVTAENRKRLEAFGDTGRYNIPGKAALHLARGWHRFGKERKAMAWMRYAKRKGASSEDLAEFEKDRVPGRALTRGSVRGRIRVGGRPVAGAKVGLLAVSDGRVYKPASRAFNWRMPASVMTGKDGSFRLKDLAKGEYALAALVPGDMVPPGEGAVTASNHPGLIKLSAGRPSVDVGTIAFRIEEDKPGK